MALAWVKMGKDKKKAAPGAKGRRLFKIILANVVYQEGVAQRKRETETSKQSVPRGVAKKV